MRQKITIKLEAIKRRVATLWQYRQSRSVWALAIISLVCGALFTATAYKPVATKPLIKEIDARPDKHVRRASISPELRHILNVIGDRLEKPGKERLVLTGTLTRFNGASQETNAFRLISEFPRKLRLEEIVANRVVIRVFNGNDAATSNGPAARHDRDVIETLVFDSVDGFFDSQLQGAAIRLLGNRFRLDGGDNEDYSGPFYDIYQLVRQIRIGQDSRQQVKLFYFNSDTLLLERVKYEIERDGSPVTVEIEMSNWAAVTDQRLPGVITRRENGEAVLRLTIATAAVLPEQGDGSFDRP